MKTVKVGDRVGVGAQVAADLTCVNCKADNENYCPNLVDTFGSYYEDGVMSQGGYSSHIRAHEYFVFQIPDEIESEIAAPMLCAGITGECCQQRDCVTFLLILHSVYSPLVRLGTGPGKKVAIVGL